MSKKKLLLAATLVVCFISTGLAQAESEANDNKDKQVQPSLATDCGPVQFSDAQKKLIDKTTKDLFAKNQVLYEKLSRLQWQMGQVLAAKDFNKAEFLLLNSQLHVLREKITSNGAAAYASIAGGLSPRQRDEVYAYFNQHQQVVQHPHPMSMSPTRAILNNVYVAEPNQTPVNQNYPPYSSR